LIAVYKGRPELVDCTSPETATTLLSSMHDPELAAGCERVLRHPGPGKARNELCRQAFTNDDAKRIALDMGWRPAAKQDQVVFFLLTGQHDRFVRLDPTGTRLRDAYRQSGYMVQREIRAAVRGLALEHPLAAERTKKRGADRAPRGKGAGAAVTPPPCSSTSSPC
jgi:hypothetical protein